MQALFFYYIIELNGLVWYNHVMNTYTQNRFIILGRCFAIHLRLVSFAVKRLPVFRICSSIQDSKTMSIY